MNPFWYNNNAMMPNYFGHQLFHPFSIPPPPPVQSSSGNLNPSTSVAPMETFAESKISGQHPVAAKAEDLKSDQLRSNWRHKRSQNIPLDSACCMKSLAKPKPLQESCSSNRVIAAKTEETKSDQLRSNWRHKRSQNIPLDSACCMKSLAKRKPIQENCASSRVVAPQHKQKQQKRNRRKARTDKKQQPTKTETGRAGESMISRNEPRSQACQVSTQNYRSGEHQQNNDLVVAVMAIALALQSSTHSETVAAPDGIQLD